MLCKKSLLRIVLPGLLVIFLGACASGSSDRKSNKEISDLYYQMGVRYLQLGKVDIALEKLEYSLEKNPDNSAAHDALAALYDSIGMSGKAAEHYQEALDLAPDNPQAENNYGAFLCKRGDYAQGMAYLKKAIARPLNNRKWFALTNAGRCEIRQGNIQQAERYFRSALQLNPDYPAALLEMLKLSYKKGNYGSARGFLQRYQSVVKDNAEILWYGWQIERALGHQSLAESYRRQLLEKFPNSEQAQKVQKLSR